MPKIGTFSAVFGFGGKPERFKIRPLSFIGDFLISNYNLCMIEHKIPEVRDADFENRDEIWQLALVYVSVPHEWDDSWTVTDELIKKNFDWLLEKQDELKCLVAFSTSKLVGVHIVHRPTQQLDQCFIKTLWVDVMFRNLGLGSSLKMIGEKWAREIGSKKIVTQVIVKNSRMVEFNKKKGFTPTRLEMEKVF